MPRTLNWRQLERCYLLRALVLGRVSGVLSASRCGSALPVFAQHAPGPVYLNCKLERIQAAGYRTYDTLDLEEWALGRKDGMSPAVVLTFDDGLRRFRDVTFPQLQARGMKSVLFVCAGLVEIASSTHSSPLREYVRADVLTWDELKALQDTGLVDVQSHGMWHHMVSVTDEIERYDNKPPRSVIEGQELLPPERGLATFFEAGLSHLVARRRARPFFLTSPRQCSEATNVAQQADMLKAKQLIEQRLPGSIARAFAFPWWNGTSVARRAVYRAGYTQLLEGARSVRRRAAFADFLRKPIGRLSFDFIDCLPGEGRRGLYELVRAKARGEYGSDVD